MTAVPLNAVIKTCSCGLAFDAEAWAKLPLCGHVAGLELRHCHCKSTIAIEQSEAK